MGPIEKVCFEAENNRKQKSNIEVDKISPRVQLFIDKCERIIKILKDDKLLEEERAKYKNNKIIKLANSLRNIKKRFYT